MSDESPAKAVLEKAGDLAKEAGSGCSVELAAPAWAIRDDGGRDDASLSWAVGWLVAVALLLIGLAGVFLLALHNSNASTTVDNALGISLAAVLALAVLVGRFALAKRTPESILRLRIGKPTEQPSQPGQAPGAAATAVQANTPVNDEAGGEGSLSGLTAILAKEPVLVQAAVLVAGILAIGFSTELSGSAVGGIAAGAAAALGLLTRTATTSVAEPKGASGETLSPEKS